MNNGIIENVILQFAEAFQYSYHSQCYIQIKILNQDRHIRRNISLRPMMLFSLKGNKKY